MAPWTRRFAIGSLALLAAWGAGCAKPLELGRPSAEGDCIPGERRACVGEDACEGGQSCAEDGTRFMACECGGGSAGAAGESAGDGGNDAPDARPHDPIDPCGGVSPTGTCASPSQVKYCITPTGQGETTVVTYACSPNEACSIVEGVGACRPLPTKCSPGKTECTGADTARFCEASGEWTTFGCPECRSSVLGTPCPGSTSSKAWSGVLKYQARTMNAAKTGWSSSPFVANGQNVLVVSYRFDVPSSKYVIIDTAVTDDSGGFTVQIPLSPSPDDQIAFYAIRLRSNGTDIAYAVAEPDVPDGEWDDTKPIPAEKTRYWSWSASTSTLGPSGGTITVKEAQASGALRVFDWLRYAHDATEGIMTTQGKSLVVWWRMNTSWGCGACMGGWPASVGSTTFSSQIWIPATAQDTSYWSDAATAHELGHWVMSSFGTSPGEGGTHRLTCTTFPGQAWSEGFATWFSSVGRSDPVYYDKQQGTFFWFDLGARQLSTGTLWSRPSPSAGLLQLIDENEVAAMLWAMTTKSNPALLQPGNALFYEALRSPIVNKQPGDAYGRMYTQHTWTLGSGCEKGDVKDTRWPVPTFADYLDALRCSGMSQESVDAATQPTLHYPYPSAFPICN